MFLNMNKTIIAHKNFHFFFPLHKHFFVCCIGYAYKYNGGCATSTELYPRFKSGAKESTEACYRWCKMTNKCEYFEYDKSGKFCHLHHSGITRGNGYPNVKCYKMGKYKHFKSI